MCRIDTWLSMQVAIDRKPVLGCEMQNLVDGTIGFTLQPKIAKTTTEESYHEVEGQSDLFNAAEVISELTKLWQNKGDMTAHGVGCSSFAPTTKVLDKIGPGFIENLESSTVGLPMVHHLSVELQRQGQHVGVHTKEEEGN